MCSKAQHGERGDLVVVVMRRDADAWQAEMATIGVAGRARSLGTLDRRVRDLLGSD